MKAPPGPAAREKAAWMSPLGALMETSISVPGRNRLAEDFSAHVTTICMGV